MQVGSMVWGMQCSCEPASVLVPAQASTCVARAGGRNQGRPARVNNYDRRTELTDLLLLRLARKEASIPGRSSYVPRGGPVVETRIKLDRKSSPGLMHNGAATEVASRVLQENATMLFADVCVNPKLISPEAAEFMLSVATSQSVLSLDESNDASYVDLILKGVLPGLKLGPVLLVCTTTMFGDAIEKLDVEKALRRAELWRIAVGPSFSILPVVAGYALPLIVADFAKDLGVFPCNINQSP